MIIVIARAVLLDAHLRTVHVATLAAALQMALVAPPTATVYEVASEGPLA